MTAEPTTSPKHKIAGAPISWGVLRSAGMGLPALVLTACSRRCAR
jgi:hypothetical protein